MTGDQVSALVGAQYRRIDLEVVDSVPVNRFVPQLHRICDASARVVAVAAPGSAATVHGDLDRAAYADEQHRQPAQLPGAGGRDLPRDRVGVVVDGVDDDVGT